MSEFVIEMSDVHKSYRKVQALDGILAQGRSFPGAMAETFPMSLKEIFLGHVRSH